MTEGKVFIDSNIFLYSLDSSDKAKNKTSSEVILKYAKENLIVISTQVLNEVYVVAVKKLGIDPISAKEFIRTMKKFYLISITPEIIESAIDCSILNRISYRDALMIATAETSGCTTLVSEDLNAGQRIRGVEILNPFLPVKS